MEIDTTLISLILSAVGAVVGWAFGRSKRKADDSNALLTSIDTQSVAFSKQIKLNEELSTKYLDIFQENVKLREQVSQQAQELVRLREDQKVLQQEVERLREELSTVLKKITYNV